jgi:hypothetical protein
MTDALFCGKTLDVCGVAVYRNTTGDLHLGKFKGEEVLVGVCDRYFPSATAAEGGLLTC